MSEIQTTFGALLPAVGTPEKPGPLVRLADVRLPAKTAYDVLKLCKLASERVAEFTELKDKAIVELGEEREPTPEEAQRNGGKPVMEVTPENRLAFFTRVQELAAVEVTIPWKPLALDALGDVEVSADELNALGVLLEG